MTKSRFPWRRPHALGSTSRPTDRLLRSSTASRSTRIDAASPQCSNPPADTLMAAFAKISLKGPSLVHPDRKETIPLASGPIVQLGGS